MPPRLCRRSLWQRVPGPQLAVSVPAAAQPTYAIGGTAILQVLEQAVEGAKSLDQEKIRDFIQKNEFKTVAGNDGTADLARLWTLYAKRR